MFPLALYNKTFKKSSVFGNVSKFLYKYYFSVPSPHSHFFFSRHQKQKRCCKFAFATAPWIGLFICLLIHLFLTYSLALPVENAAKFNDVGIAQGHQLCRGFLAPSAASAIDQNQLVLLGQ